jgi:MoxR-like ATPase
MASGKSEKLQRDVESYHTLTTRLIDGLERVIRGKRRTLEYLITGLLAGGHVLIEDVPGLGKTTLAKTAARLISRDKTIKPVTFRRIQFTPDLLPYDITGVDIFDPEHRRFVFRAGPVFASIVLADEINRTTPKVQSALLEVMAENQVTVGNKTHAMDPLFFVIATQNPVETDGTYSLPLAQLDRFLMRISIGYPGEEDEIGIVRDDPSATVMPKIKPICSKSEILRARKTVEAIYCDERLLRAAVGVSASTRRHRGIELGCSPRASLMLVRAARAFALIRGRSYCIDQDFLELAPLVLTHRIRLKDIRIDAASLIREMTLHELSRIAY